MEHGTLEYDSTSDTIMDVTYGDAVDGMHWLRVSSTRRNRDRSETETDLVVWGRGVAYVRE